MQTKEYPSQHWFKRYIHYNPLTGEFTRIQKAANHRGLGLRKAKSNLLTLHGEKYSLNKVAWIYMTGEQPNNIVHHKDGDTTNYKFGNLQTNTLRACTRKRGSKWSAYFYLDNGPKQYYAGMHDTEEEALTAAQAGAMLEILEQKGAR